MRAAQPATSATAPTLHPPVAKWLAARFRQAHTASAGATQAVVRVQVSDNDPLNAPAQAQMVLGVSKAPPVVLAPVTESTSLPARMSAGIHTSARIAPPASART